ncbi:hypothetical protein [Blastococcus sp. Marseille-P5729]|uniref:hypothetical protein n=1 Tax=Blastococcus sp. Marseille-P5729 TaxID=2086582 RepID=UPI000D1044FA|nr:hypothetical protein [Blastococcus sp. Marseille-P5729]
MRRLIIAVLLLLTTACGTIAGKPTAAPEALPDDLLVFRVSYGPGLAMEVEYLTAGPALSIYGDGRVMVTLKEYPTIPQLEVGQISPVRVAKFVAQVSDTGLVDDSVDYGDPMVTDAGSTGVLLNDGVQEQQISVYALSTDSGLSQAQSSRRSELQDLIDEAWDLTTTAQATPERIQVMSTSAASYDRAGATWPGPAPSTFMTDSDHYFADQCGVLKGESAAMVYDAAVANDGQLWSVDGETIMLAVRPLLPDETGCAAD